MQIHTRATTPQKALPLASPLPFPPAWHPLAPSKISIEEISAPVASWHRFVVALGHANSLRREYSALSDPLSIGRRPDLIRPGDLFAVPPAGFPCTVPVVFAGRALHQIFHKDDVNESTDASSPSKAIDYSGKHSCKPSVRTSQAPTSPRRCSQVTKVTPQFSLAIRHPASRPDASPCSQRQHGQQGRLLPDPRSPGLSPYLSLLASNLYVAGITAHPRPATGPPHFPAFSSPPREIPAFPTRARCSPLTAPVLTRPRCSTCASSRPWTRSRSRTASACSSITPTSSPSRRVSRRRSAAPRPPSSLVA